MTATTVRLAWQKVLASGRAAELKVALLSSFTVNPLCPYLGMALEDAGLPSEVHVGPYDQILQQCLDPTSEIAQLRPSVLIVWTRFEDLWAARSWPLDDPSDDFVGDLLAIVDATIAASAALSATLVFVLPAVPEVRPLGVGDAGNPQGVYAVATAAREAARSHLAGTPGVLIADAEEVVRRIGSVRALDWRRLAMSRIPYSEEMFAALGERVARLIRVDRRGATKVVAVDADNTLWGGVVGEDGAEHIDLLDNGPGEAFRDFQRYLLELRRSGCLLTLTSKNNEPDVWEAFGRREMVMQRSDLAAWRVNWAPKSAAIQEMAEELNLGTASFVLIDDSAIERAEVELALPGVRTVPMPQAAEQWFDTIAWGGALDRLPPTGADRGRALSYERESNRRVAREAMSTDEFLLSLDLHVHLEVPTAADLSRFAQLVAKTNQFTLGGHRRSEAELTSCLADPRYALEIVSARDRFGDYGVIGALVVDRVPEQAGVPVDVAVLDTFALSCRAMGRGVEIAMLAAAFDLAGPDLWTIVQLAPKNQPARDFFASFGAQTGRIGPLQRAVWPSHIEGNAGTAFSHAESGHL